MRNEHKNKLPFNYLSSQIQHKFRWNRCSHILHWEITFHEFSPNYVSYTRHSNEMFTLFNFWVNNLQKVKESERERVSPPPNRVHLFTQGKKNIIFTVLISFYVVAKHQKGNNKNKAFMKILDEN